MASTAVRIVTWEKTGSGSEWRAVCDDGSDLYLTATDVQGISRSSGWKLPSAPLLIEVDRVGNLTSWIVDSPTADALPEDSEPGSPKNEIPEESTGSPPLVATRRFLRSVLVYLACVAGGVVAGQVAALVAGRIVDRAAVLGNALSGGSVIWNVGAIIGSTVYAFAVFVGVGWGLAAFTKGTLSSPESITEPEGLGGLIGGVVAFLLVTLLSEPFYDLVFTTLPFARSIVLESDTAVRLPFILTLHAAAVAAVALTAYLPIRAAYHRSNPCRAHRG